MAVGLLMLMMLAVEVRPARAVDGGGAFNVTNNTTNDYSPSYSPSGEKIAYRVSGRSDGLRNDIYTINVDGTGRFNVTNDTTDERDPSYSPDGEKIAYAGWDGQDWEIYTINADGGERIQLTNNTTNDMELSYSPDGLKIAYEGYDGHDTEIYTINAGGDTIAPKIVSVMPARGATGVFTGVNLKATFSEPVYDVKGNFKLYRIGSTTPMTGVVAPVEGTNNTKWVLNPNRSLRAGTTYVAKVLTGVKDEAGNNLDQKNRTMASDQPMQWSFKTRS